MGGLLPAPLSVIFGCYRVIYAKNLFEVEANEVNQGADGAIDANRAIFNGQISVFRNMCSDLPFCVNVN